MSVSTELSGNMMVSENEQGPCLRVSRSLKEQTFINGSHLSGYKIQADLRPVKEGICVWGVPTACLAPGAAEPERGRHSEPAWWQWREAGLQGAVRFYRAPWHGVWQHEEGKLPSSPLLLLPLPALPDGIGSETGCTRETGSLEGWHVVLLARETFGSRWVGGEW